MDEFRFTHFEDAVLFRTTVPHYQTRDGRRIGHAEHILTPIRRPTRRQPRSDPGDRQEIERSARSDDARLNQIRHNEADMIYPLRLRSIAFFLALIATQAQAQSRKPSTPEDRAKAVEIARSLEIDPLSKEAKEQRKWMVLWLTDVPDINVKLCGNLLGPLLNANKNYSAEIVTQMVPSGAAFIISNPDKAKDDVAVYMAAVEGSLRTYESILKATPKAKWPFLDDLIEKRNRGELGEHVRQAATHCK